MKKLKSEWITKNPESRLYQIPVPIIGLTGGIGTGKSTVAEILREKNIPVIDADKLVKNIYQKAETLEFIAKHFPRALVEGTINFKNLRETAFLDPLAKKLIEDFIYTYMPEEFKKAYATFSNPQFIVYDVPLLFEKKLNELVDLSVCVYTPRETQIERIIARDKSSRELASKIIDNQMDIEEKKKLSDFVISNTSDLVDLKISVEQFLKDITV
ncbi:MAG: dephospho-CoA kinase [Alphaproteobacteria bacterium]|nr:MAG: dephospho-CoA kinase [Alphaproteobacteria bacterium]